MSSPRYRFKAWVPILAMIAMLMTGCKEDVTVNAYVVDGNMLVIEVTITWERLEKTSAPSVYETREVDPDLLGNDPNYPHRGTVTLTLNDGSTVSYSQDLYYDSSTVVGAVTSGHTALAYRAVDPAGLQNFLDQYEGRVASVQTHSRVGLLDFSSDSTSTTVDCQGSADNETTYIGTAGVTTTSNDPFQKDL